MPAGILKLKLKDRKDHFIATIYKDQRQKFQITRESILLLKINSKIIIKIPNKDFHISIPKSLVESGTKDKIKARVLKIYSKEEGKLRESSLFQNNDVNIKALVPKETIFGNEIFVLDENDECLYIWYCIGGGADHVKIKKKLDAEKLAELMGFYFGDGNTSHGIRSFRLNNCEHSALNYCLDILENLGISRSQVKVQVIYSSDTEIEDRIKKRCTNYWANTLELEKKQIVSVNRSKNIRRTLEYGSARIFFDNSVFVEIMLHGVLKRFIEIIKKPKNDLEENILKGFIRGLAAAEGSVTLTRLNSLSKVTFAYDPHSEDLEFYKKILENLRISYGGIHGNELNIYGIKNFNKFNEIDLFKIHETRKKKFEKGYKNHKFSI